MAAVADIVVVVVVVVGGVFKILLLLMLTIFAGNIFQFPPPACLLLLNFGRPAASVKANLEARCCCCCSCFCFYFGRVLLLWVLPLILLQEILPLPPSQCVYCRFREE